jgi:hypothetical protein
VSTRSNIRKRERQKQRHSPRPKQADKPIAHVVKTADLIASISRPLSSRAFSAALQETQSTKL